MAGMCARAGAAMREGLCLVQSGRDAGDLNGRKCTPPDLAFLYAQ